MSDEMKVTGTTKFVTEREAVLRERAAWIKGARFAEENHTAVHPLNCEPCREYAASLYCLPRVTRPRVVADPHKDARGWDQLWRAVAGKVQWRGCSGEWYDLGIPGTSQLADGGRQIMDVTRERALLWADLLANPTETVEDESA